MSRLSPVFSQSAFLVVICCGLFANISAHAIAQSRMPPFGGQ